MSRFKKTSSFLIASSLALTLALAPVIAHAQGVAPATKEDLSSFDSELLESMDPADSSDQTASKKAAQEAHKFRDSAQEKRKSQAANAQINERHDLNLRPDPARVTAPRDQLPPPPPPKIMNGAAPTK